jgi:signal transduction histidine kinase
MGAGFGLSQSKQIIRNHEGLLRLISVPNERTSFVISFG